MKKGILISVIILLYFGVFAQNENTESMQKQDIQLSSQSDSLQYALGAYLGQWMVKNSFEVQNANLFLLGMDDVLQNRALQVNDSIIAPLVSAYQLTNQYQKSQLVEKQLFESLNGKAGVGVLPSGVSYIVVEKGTGNRPNNSDTIVFHAKGIFPDGTIFEDTYTKKQAITNAMINLIPGLNDAVQLMPVGSVWRVFIPSALAYGSAGLKDIIPPYTALVFDISLIEIKEEKRESRQSR
jgi:FKBP-type peptidyl-prolyl cis-trans isomerase